MLLRQWKFIAEMPNGGRGPVLRGVYPPFSILSVSCRLSLSPSAPTPSGLTRDRLQLRAAASRWNFLTNTRPGRRCAQHGGATRAHAPALAAAGAGRLGCNSWGGPRDCALQPGEFP